MSFKNRCYGLVVIRSENSNWNADFSGFPRRLPDEKGTIFSTDKALKYAIRKYFVDTGETVFVWKSVTEDKTGKYSVRSLKDRYDFMKKKLLKEGKDKKKEHDEIFEVFSKCLDIRLFGITFAAKKDMSIGLTGPVQISYGVNRCEQNVVYSNQILSPYSTPKNSTKSEGEDNSEENKGGSFIGSQARALTSYYVYDFAVNPKNISDHMEDYYKDKEKMEDMLLTDDDIEKLKQALKKAATHLNSTSKMGNENIMTLFITLKEDDKLQLPSLKNLLTFKENEDKPYCDMAPVVKLLEPFNDRIKVELFTNSALVTLANVPEKILGPDAWWEVKDILE